MNRSVPNQAAARKAARRLSTPAKFPLYCLASFSPRGGSGTSGGVQLSRLASGLDWAPCSATPDECPRSVTWGIDCFAGVGYSEAIVYKDGVHWSPSQSGTNELLSAPGRRAKIYYNSCLRTAGIGTGNAAAAGRGTHRNYSQCVKLRVRKGFSQTALSRVHCPDRS